MYAVVKILLPVAQENMPHRRVMDNCGTDASSFFTKQLCSYRRLLNDNNDCYILYYDSLYVFVKLDFQN